MKKKKKKQETGEFTADDRHHSQPDPQHLRKGTLDSVAIHVGGGGGSGGQFQLGTYIVAA